MIDYIKNLLLGTSQSKSSPVEKQQKIQIASCALMIEVASADDHFSDSERKTIIDIMQKTFSLTPEYTEELMEMAKEKITSSVSIYEFTDIINSNFTREEKLEILLNLWRLIFVDDIMNKYEEFLVRRIAGNLKLEHQDLIEAKLTAKSERKTNRI